MEPIPQKSKVLHKAKRHTTGGREHGVSRRSDCHLEVKLSTLHSYGVGSNPEQLFAAGWSSMKALCLYSRKRNIKFRDSVFTAIRLVYSSVHCANLVCGSWFIDEIDVDPCPVLPT